MAMSVAPAFAQENAMENDDELVNAEIDANDALPPSNRACFYRRDALNFDAISDQFIYVEGRRDQHFLMTTDGTCAALAGTNAIAISSRMMRICSNNYTRISYRSADQVETCRIRKVERVDSEAAAETLAESRGAGRSQNN
jgi:hypothetical protein